MLWIAFTVLSAAVMASANLFGKYVIDKEVKDPITSAGVTGMSLFTVLGIISVVTSRTLFSLEIIIPSMGVGFFYSLALSTYYSGIKREDASRFIPTLSTTTIFTVLLAFLFLGELFTPGVYAGILLVIAGSVFVSLRGLRHFQSLSGFVIAIVSALIFSMRDIFLKFSTGNASFWQVLTWASVGGLIVSLFFIFSRKGFTKKITKGEEHLLAVGFLSAVAYTLYAKAVSLGPVSLVSSVFKVKIIMVFASSTAISYMYPKIIKERLDRYTLLQKVIAISLILVGVVVIRLLM
ncbi:MAG: EamA family transporter [Candidatus Aenigmatarchaeota archaeon]